MNKTSNWIFIIVVASIILLILYSILLNKSKPGVVDDKIVIALIGSLTAIITVVGSIYINKQLSNENAKQQRAVEVRKMKQDYYHRFTESFLLRITFSLNETSPEFLEADKIFCIEKNRLPLYASQQVVELIEKVANGKSDADFKLLFEMIRKDLKNDEFKDFTDLNELSVTLPTKATRLGSIA